MAVVKRSVSFRREIWEELARRADAKGGHVSGLVNEALEHYLTLQRGLDAAREWEEVHDPFTPEEIAAADRELDEAGVYGWTRPSHARSDLR